MYGGASPASAVETQVIQARTNELADRLHAFVTVHTAAYMWLHPLGNTDETGACDYAETHDLLVRNSN